MTTKSLTALSFALIAVAAVVFPGTSQARDFDRRGAEVRVSSVPPRPVARGSGHYELVTTQVWIPATSERVWVETCRPRGKADRHQRHRRCDGDYETQTRGGHYEEQHAWVWVPAPSRPQVVVQVPNPLGLDIRVTL